MYPFAIKQRRQYDYHTSIGSGRTIVEALNNLARGLAERIKNKKPLTVLVIEGPNTNRLFDITI
jgi:hypothetical protein